MGISGNATLLYKVQEELGDDWNKTTLYGAFENLLDEIKDDERFRPDLVIYIGGHIVSKKLKSYLRSLKGVEQIRISQEADIEDTFMHLTKVMDLPNSDAMSWLDNLAGTTTGRIIANCGWMRWLKL